MLHTRPQPAVAMAVPGYGPLNGLVRQAQMNQRQEDARQRAALAHECAPHPMSVIYAAPLTPAANVKSIVSGKTLYLDTAIVANHQLVRMKEDAMYLAANGKSYTPAWDDKRWYVQDNAVCIAGNQATCMPVFTDNTGGLYMGSPQGLLLKLARVEPGDTAHVRAAYAQNMRDQARREEMATAFIGLLAAAAMSGGGGGGGGGSHDTYYMRQQESSSGGSSYSAPPAEPIGGRGGLYGDAHGVGD